MNVYRFAASDFKVKKHMVNMVYGEYLVDNTSKLYASASTVFRNRKIN